MLKLLECLPSYIFLKQPSVIDFIMKKTLFHLIVVSLFLGYTTVFAEKNQENHRVIILSDIEADPDDTQSLVRLFLYSNVIDIKGLVATTSCWKQGNIQPASIHRIIDRYGLVYPNLIKHEDGFPAPNVLHALVKAGQPGYGLADIGTGKETEGSNLIIEELEKDDDRPLWISVWGGVNTLAQTLHTIRETRSEEVAAALIDKIRVYTISDQDDTGSWIRNEFPGVFYIVTPGDNYAWSTWIAINNEIEGIDNSSVGNTWFADNIQQDHGPLGAAYPDVAWGVEGDTPAFLSLIPNGLNVPERPDWGGWGGRYERYLPEFSKDWEGGSIVTAIPETRPFWTNADDTYIPYVFSEYKRSFKPGEKTFTGNQVTLWRWRDDFQNDFAARMDWCVSSYEEANHAPVIVLNHPEEITVKSGAGFSLGAFNSYDPDGDSYHFLWTHYQEAGSYNEQLNFVPPNQHMAHMTAPVVEQTETLHIILKMTDKGTPRMSSYKRIIVTVEP